MYKVSVLIDPEYNNYTVISSFVFTFWFSNIYESSIVSKAGRSNSYIKIIASVDAVLLSFHISMVNLYAIYGINNFFPIVKLRFYVLTLDNTKFLFISIHC
jgi:hypothetical protein